MDDLERSLEHARLTVARLREGEAKTRLTAEVEALRLVIDAWQRTPPELTARDSVRRRIVSLEIVLAKGT